MYQPGKFLSLACRNTIIVHDVKRIAGLPHVQPRERAPGAADRVERSVFAVVQHVEVFEGFFDESLRFLERLAGDVLERKATERQRYAAAHARAVDVDKLQRTTTEVTDNTVRPVDSGHNSKRREMSLALPGKYCDCCAANAFGFGNERSAIARIPACRCGNCPDTPDMQDIAQGPETDQRVERRIDCIRRQQAGRLNLAPQPGEDLFIEDRRRRPGQSLIDDQTNRIGTDVNNGDWRTVVEAALRRRNNRGRAL